jgi:site-specific DNA-methyltransferase (adenine-specific)
LCARKPLQGTVAANVLRWGTGGINVDGGRVGMTDEDRAKVNAASWSAANIVRVGYGDFADDGAVRPMNAHAAGRWPANIVHDGSEEVEAVFPVTGPSSASDRGIMGGSPFSGIDGSGLNPGTNGIRGHDDAGGSASRFYYAAKASREEREHGLSHLPRGLVDAARELDSAGRNSPRAGVDQHGKGRANIHPTVKPVDLMRWLTRLVTPPGGTVVDPYTGSGTTGVACALEGFQFLGCELETPHALIAHERIRTALEEVERAKVETPTGQLLLLPGFPPKP